MIKTTNTGFTLIRKSYLKPMDAIVHRSHLKKWILVQGQGGRYIRTGGILVYFEDLARPESGSIPHGGDLLANLAPNAEIGPKDFFEIASTLFELVGNHRKYAPVMMAHNHRNINPARIRAV